MDHQKLIDYIKEQLSQGASKEIIVNSLIGVGWQTNDIELGFNAINKSSTVYPTHSSPNATVTEQNYPVEGRWIFKSILGSLLAVFILTPIFLLSEKSVNVNVSMIIYIGLVPLNLIYALLRRATFHYSIEKEFLLLKQGILSRQQRHIPYGVIQNVFVKQDLFDRLFSLCSLTLENASEGGKNRGEGQTKVFGIKVSNKNRQQTEMVGFSGNKVSIPGLKKQNAEILKGIILQKMKENQIDDGQSGL